MLVDNGQLAAGRRHIQAPNGRVQLQDVDRKRIVHKDLENLLVGGNKGLVSIKRKERYYLRLSHNCEK